MGDRLKISLTAPPVDGKANQRLVKFLAKQFGVAVSQVSLVAGAAHRDKTLRIQQPQKVPDSFGVSQDGS